MLDAPVAASSVRLRWFPFSVRWNAGGPDSFCWSVVRAATVQVVRDPPGVVGDPPCASHRIETFDAFDRVESSRGNLLEHALAVFAALVLKQLPCRLEVVLADCPFSVHERCARFVHRWRELSRDYPEL
jgi:hypothetical protein